MKTQRPGSSKGWVAHEENRRNVVKPRILLDVFKDINSWPGEIHIQAVRALQGTKKIYVSWIRITEDIPLLLVEG